MRIILGFLFSISILWSIDVDMEALKRDIQEDSTNIDSRVVLARNYINNGRLDEAKELLKQVLDVDKHHIKAKVLIKDIKKLKQISMLTQSGNLTENAKVSSYLSGLFNMGDHESIVMIFEVMQRNNIALESSAYLTVVDSYIHSSNLDKALSIAKSSSLSSMDKYYIKAKIENIKGHNLKSEYFYQLALKEGDREDIALGLYDLYVKQKHLGDAKELLKSYQQKGLQNPVYIALKQREQDILFNRADRLEREYKKSNLFKDFKKYYYELEGLKHTQEALDKLKSFVKENPQDEKAVLFLANKYYWDNKPKKSLQILQPVINSTKNRDILTLYTDIFLQLGKSQEALVYLQKIIKLGGDTKKVEATIEKIKTDTKDKGKYQTDKESAEIFYFKKDYLKSIPHYKRYFASKRNDNDTRFHYASALEKLKLYPQAQNQYRLVAKKEDKLYTLSLYRFARVLMVQKDEKKWNKARVVLKELSTILNEEEPSAKRDNLLKYTQKSLEIVSKPMPKPTKHKDIMLTEVQKKILDEPTLAGGRIDKKDISSVKQMTSVQKSKKMDATLFGYIFDDDSVRNNFYGLRLNNILSRNNSSLALEVKRSSFEDRDDTKKISREIKANSLTAYYDMDQMSFSLGVNNFEDSTDFAATINYQQFISNHDITYGLGYQNAIFINGIPCMIDDDIKAISLSLYDMILLKSLEQAEFSLKINRFSDSNINVNTQINYPIHKIVNNDFENTFALAGNYEYNTKSDTCYDPIKLFDGNYVKMKSKYRFSRNSFIEGVGSIGYSIKNSDLLYSYGFVLQIISDKSFDVSINCHHFQSGYSPDGANECYASITHVW